MKKPHTHLIFKDNSYRYSPAKNSLFATNIITCNKTNKDGSVENILELNADSARKVSQDIKL